MYHKSVVLHFSDLEKPLTLFFSDLTVIKNKDTATVNNDIK